MIKRTRLQAYKHWLKALRSKQYQQATLTLRSSWKHQGETQYAYCCLGVLCDLAVKDGGVPWDASGRFDNSMSQLTERVRNFMGLSKQNMTRLINLNDKFGCTFQTIADEIETKIMPKALLRGVK